MAYLSTPPLKPKAVRFGVFFPFLVGFDLPVAHQAERAIAWLVRVFLPVLGKVRALLSTALSLSRKELSSAQYSPNPHPITKMFVACTGPVPPLSSNLFS